MTAGSAKFDLSPLATLQALGVKLVPTGQNTYRCACPVHAGDRASMAVGRVHGKWRCTCFACGFGGDAIDLVQAVRGCDFKTALAELGGAVPTDGPPVDLHPRDYVMVCCDRCGASFRAEGATYKVPGTAGALWTTTALQEAFFRPALLGWETGAEGVGHLCRACVAHHDGEPEAPSHVGHELVGAMCVDCSTGPDSPVGRVASRGQQIQQERSLKSPVAGKGGGQPQAGIQRRDPSQKM